MDEIVLIVVDMALGAHDHTWTCRRTPAVAVFFGLECLSIQ
jgi:hypothetical protein